MLRSANGGKPVLGGRIRFPERSSTEEPGFTRDSRTEPPYERSTLKSAVNALTAFIQKSGDVYIHESCPCSESRSFRNLDSATGKIHFARLDANPMSSRLAPKAANEVSHGVNLI